MRYRGGVRAGATILLLLALAGASCAQRGADLVAFDAVQAGRAGVDVAIAEEVAALLTNPSGLVRLPAEWTVELSGRAFFSRFEYEDALNPGGEEADELVP